MIIPVIFSLHPIGSRFVHSWAFYKCVALVKDFGWPLFAQRQFFVDKDAQEKVGILSVANAEYHDFPIWKPEDDTRYIQEAFPEDFIKEYLAKYPSETDAALALEKEPWPEMTAYLVERVRCLEMQLGEKTEAFIGPHLSKFVHDAAAELGIPIIQYEFGPFRRPVYRHAAYFDFKGSIITGEMAERYEAFLPIARQVPLLSRREILALFLMDEHLHYATDEDIEPQYDGGLTPGYSVPIYYSAYSQLTTAEMQVLAQEHIGNNLCIHYHPGDPLRGRVWGIPEHEGSLIDFIRKCKRILCCSSNIAYEAMLYNRPSYDMGASMYGQFANHSLEGLPDHIADDAYLNFIAFGYLVPFELLKSIDYLRWRLSRPSEKEIYEYHLSYYLNCLQIGQEVLSLPTTERLSAILKCRGMQINDPFSFEEVPLWLKKDETSRLYAQLQRQENKLRQYESQHRKAIVQIEQLNTQIEQLNAQSAAASADAAALRQSRWYRWSRPIAKVKQRLLR